MKKLLERYWARIYRWNVIILQSCFLGHHCMLVYQIAVWLLSPLIGCLGMQSGYLEVLWGGHYALGVICAPVLYIFSATVLHCSCYVTSSVGASSAVWRSGQGLLVIPSRLYRAMVLLMRRIGVTALSGGGLELLLSTPMPRTHSPCIRPLDCLYVGISYSLHVSSSWGWLSY